MSSIQALLYLTALVANLYIGRSYSSKALYIALASKISYKELAMPSKPKKRYYKPNISIYIYYASSYIYN